MPVVSSFGSLPRGRTAGLYGNSLECLSGLLGASVRAWMDTRCVAPGLETRGCSCTGHSLSSFLTFHLIQTCPFFTSFLPKVGVNLLRSEVLWGEPATLSCSRLHCYLGVGGGGWWLLWKLEGLVPSLVGCGEWGLLGLQVGEAGNILGLSFCWSSYQPWGPQRG